MYMYEPDAITIYKVVCINFFAFLNPVLQFIKQQSNRCDAMLINGSTLIGIFAV